MYQERGKGVLSTREIAEAERYWIKVTQNQAFTDEKKPLRTGWKVDQRAKIWTLNPFLDQHGLWPLGVMTKSIHWYSLLGVCWPGHTHILTRRLIADSGIGSDDRKTRTCFNMPTASRLDVAKYCTFIDKTNYIRSSTQRGVYLCPELAAGRQVCCHLVRMSISGSDLFPTLAPLVRCNAHG